MKRFKLHGIRIKHFFKRPKVKSAEGTIGVNHIFDETVSGPNKALMGCNVHGFDEGPGSTYWIGLDLRSFGIRVADYIIKCKNKSTYDKGLDAATRDTEHILSKMKSAPELTLTNGDDVNIEYIFRWGDDEKTFDVHLWSDWYAEEK